MHTSEQDRALAFYEEVFGYSNRDGDLKRPDGHTVAAIVFPRILEEIDEDDEDDKQYLQRMRGSIEFPDLTAWLTYFAVPDAQEAVDLLLSIGGWAHEEEGVTENPWGRLAAVKDPFGTPFRLVLPWEVI
ncbi:VOC family protein [Actinocorallia sp. B10E7]|uniref:VOC family protein n=1 Tax=Actinocorallia sp. B10E7 TaxID=3153558 RepID=UPI00325C812E